jgi:hypothetical protein
MGALQSQRKKRRSKGNRKKLPRLAYDAWRFSEVGIKLRLVTLTPNERAKSNDRLLFDL